LWDEIVKRKQPVIAMRTVSGGPVYSLRDVPGFAWKDYLQKRAVEVAPIFEKSGIKSWTEFCVRFAHSFPQVKATVGSTSKVENLNEFLAAKDNLAPLPESIVREMEALHEIWSDELDIHAEPWRM
jgi:predicted aldo/keto reductase-like oxidoreductase